MISARPQWDAERRRMVEQQLKRRGIHDSRVLEAMGALPREQFIPEEGRPWSYADEPVSIGFGQTISQPYITALMAQVLELTGVEKVLEVGAGCGYHAAVLASLAAQVVALEILPELAAAARRNIEAAGLGARIQVITGDGSMGYSPLAPYDAISVAAGAPRVPAALTEQLADPGRMVVPVGSLDEQELLLIIKSGGRMSTSMATRCRFVPLRGGEGWRLD